MTRPRILVLGGTTEARALAQRLALRPDLDATISLAGRTIDPKPLPIAVRSGGFGGAEGLAAYLRTHCIDFLVDATHPFANQISANAAVAALETGVPILALCRPEWTRQDGDQWISVDNFDAAVGALGTEARRVFLAIGRQEAPVFAKAPQHAYLVRSVDPVEPPLPVADCRYILATGPFAEADEQELLVDNRIEIIVSKNSGGSATYGKIAAARKLGIAVVMIERQKPAGVKTVGTADAAMAIIDQAFPPA